MAAFRRIKPLLIVTLLAGCPGSVGDGTGSTTDTGSTADTGSTTQATGSTSVAPTTGSDTTAGTTSVGATSTGGGTTMTPVDDTTTGDTGDTGTTGEVTTTGEDTTTGDTGADEPSCTYPGSTSDGPAAPDLAPECACVDDQDNHGQLLCSLPICPTLLGDCPDFDLDNGCPGWNYDEEALDCALTAARDGVEGSIYWTFSPNGGFSAHTGFLHILPGRRVLRQDDTRVDLGGHVSDTNLWQLSEPDHFQGCIELDTFCARMACFFAGTEGNALSTCLPAFDYEEF